MKKKIKDLQAGDCTYWYQVIKIEKTEQMIKAHVCYNDGGTGERVWESKDFNIEVEVNGN